MSAQPRDINSAKPFESFYQKYRDKGWFGTLPLPARAKEAPPNNFTGIKPGAKFVAEQSDIDGWLQEKHWAKGNICLRMGEQFKVDGEMFEVIGIDVDHYDEKHGADELASLETKYGKLPETWICTSRTDGTSGIRFYRVRPGYAFAGKASKAIEIIQKRHRYAVVYPSWHPKTGNQYYWYEPGISPDGLHTAADLPSPYELPVLPDQWMDYLTTGYMADPGSAAMDLDSSDDEVWNWIKTSFIDGNGEGCRFLQNRLLARKTELANAPTHHDLLTSVHWEFFALGSEGHPGWWAALKDFDRAWKEAVLSSGKRAPTEAGNEIVRSRFGAMRKLKGRIDAGELQIVPTDPCAVPPLGPPPGGGFGVPPNHNVPQPNTWERNDNGNARHFIALYGNNIRYVPNHPEGGGKWIVFNENTMRWNVDTHDIIVRTLFRYVESRLKHYAEGLRTAVANAGTTATPAQKAAATAWTRWALDSGNKARVTNSLAQATYHDEIVVNYEQLDNDPYLLPVANGLIRFHTKEERDAGAPPFEWIEDVALCKEYLVTQNTNVPYIPLREQATHPDPAVRESFTKFRDYVRLFMKSHLSEQDWDYARKALGYSILGVNFKKALFLYGETDTGKSTLQRLMNAALGDLAIACEPRVFLDTQFKGSLAEALPRRMMMVGELGGKEVDAGLFKSVAGGDVISCQLKNVNTPVKMQARCTVISSCNSAPNMPEADTATVNRFIVIPFRHQVKGDEKDTAAIDALPLVCKVSALAWLIESCCDAIVSNMEDIPPGLQLEAKTFANELNDLSDFVNDCVEKCSNATWKRYSSSFDPAEPKPNWPDDQCVTLKELYAAYKVYAREQGVKDMLTQGQLTRKLKGFGFVQDPSRTNGDRRRWLGIKLKNADRVRKADTGV